MPIEITISLLKVAMEAHGWHRAKFLIDGFPRNMENYYGFFTALGDLVDVKGVLFLRVEESVMRERMLGRVAESEIVRVDDN